jgi:uncharacterized protein (DUF58 family)
MNHSLRIVIFLAIICMMGGIITGQSYYYRLSYLWVSIIILSWLVSRLSLSDLTVKRVPRALRSQVGHIFEERFEVINHGFLSHLWVEVKDNSTLPGIQTSHILSRIHGHDTCSFLTRTRLIERGIYSLGDTVFIGGDFFGLFSRKKKFPAEQHLLVYPMMVQIDNFPSPAGWLAGGEALKRRTHQITPNAVGVRDYVPGDPLNRIHWLSTARRNRYIVKEYELDPMAEVWIFLDAERKVHAQSTIKPALPQLEIRENWRPSVNIPLPASTDEYSVCIAASLARYYLKNGRVVGFVSAGKNLWVIPSDRGSRQIGKILETLALLKSDGNLPLQAVVEAQVRNLPRGSTVLLISPAYEKDIAPIIISLTQRGMHPIIVSLDSHSFGKELDDQTEEKFSIPLNIPIFRVKNGDDLTTILSQKGGKEKYRGL